jgi:hypothetical protein
VNLPDYNFLPAPLWLITLLHFVTLTLHFAAMNFMVGGVVVILFGRFHGGWENTLVKKFIRLLPSAMAATITFGVAPLLFVQLVYPKQIYSAAIVSGWFWMLIVVVAIIVYYCLYAASFSVERSTRRTGLYLSLALLGFVYISYMYSSVFSLAEKPEMYRLLYAGTQSGWLLNTDVGSYFFRWLHMIVGAITVGSFFIGWLGRKDPAAVAISKPFFLWGMIAAMVVGLVYLFTLDEIMLPFMRSPAVWILLGAIVFSLGSLHFYYRQRYVISGVLLLLSLLGMVVIRHYVRLLHLEGVYDPASYAVKPQWSVFAIFVVCFVIAIGTIWYMLRLYFAGQKRAA